MRRTFLSTGSPQTEDKRWYVLQNWRQDAAVIISDAGVQRERAFYSPYGRVFGMPAGDLNFDGEFTSAEATTISGWSAAYRADVGAAEGPFELARLGHALAQGVQQPVGVAVQAGELGRHMPQDASENRLGDSRTGDRAVLHGQTSLSRTSGKARRVMTH